MSDLLLEVGKSPLARKLLKGLPLPLPEALRRGKGPWAARPLADRAAVVLGIGETTAPGLVASTLAEAGANVFVGDGVEAEAFRGVGEAFGRPPQSAESAPKKVDAVVLDATGALTVASLVGLRELLAPWVARLARSGHVVVVGQLVGAQEGAEATAAQSALEGFVRSLGKEVGRVGATVNLLRVERGASAEGALRWLLSPRSAFVTLQPVEVRSAPLLRRWVRPLEGKVVVVTGAARGIGEATAKRLAEEGAKVVCVDRPDDAGALSVLARAIDGVVVAADLLDDDAPAKIADAVASLGGVDVVVHNAGVTRDRTLARMDAGRWDSVLGVNLAAVIRLQDALTPHLRDGGRVVCLSSIAGLAGNVGQTAYSASKSGVVGLVKAWSQSLAEKGVTVHAIAPGFIETRLTAAIPVAIREVARRLSALGQGGAPVDVAEAVVFLASPDSAGVRGGVLRVCGGAFVGA